ncbi:MAG TPA: acyclic terpene utilization AtuA family protein [Acidimicrobiales bacterium]
MTVTLGGGQGFYGDGKAPVPDVLAAGVDYLVCEALAELTLAILQKDRQRDESLGYTRDLPAYLGMAFPYVLDGRTKLITNAGGINPIAAGRAAVAAARSAGGGGTGLKIAVVVGDDLRPRAEELGLPGAASALFANAYLGAAPIVRALDAGAQIVITGRVADASLFVAPLVHEFGWAWDDWDRLAAGVVVGHLLECSGQVTGGNYSGRWWDNPDPVRIGFPIGEVEPDGSAVITKPKGTGGMVTFDTVREQLLYEVHDPSRYLNPDVVADFTSLAITDDGDDRVEVTGTRGTPAPPTYKGLICTPAGWAGECRVTYTWPDAEAKARAALSFVKARSMANGVPVDEWWEEYFGVNAFGGPAVDVPDGWEPPEVTGRLAWRTGTQADAARPMQEVGVLGLSGPPGISGLGRGGGNKPTQLLAVDPFFVDRAIVDSQVRIEIDEV